MINEDNMMKMVLQNSIIACMNIDVANVVLKINLHHLATLWYAIILHCLGIKNFERGGA